jgi:hypothetical protein
MDKKIKYYVDLLNKLQSEVDEEKSKIISYETMIMNEKTLLAHMPLFQRLFSGSKKLIVDLENSIKLIQKSIDDKKQEIEAQRTEMLSVGLLNLEDNSKEMETINELANFYYKICQNIAAIHRTLVSASQDIQSVYSNRNEAFRLYKHQAYSSSGQYFIFAYSLFMGAIGKAKEVSRLVELSGHVSSEQHPSDFQQNYKNISANLDTLEKDILQMRAAYSKSCSDPEASFMRDKLDVIHLADSLFKNLASMAEQEYKSYESRYELHLDAIKANNASRKSDVLGMIREQYSLNVF